MLCKYSNIASAFYDRDNECVEEGRKVIPRVAASTPFPLPIPKLSQVTQQNPDPAKSRILPSETIVKGLLVIGTFSLNGQQEGQELYLHLY